MRMFGTSYMMGAFEKMARPWEVAKRGVDPNWALIKEEMAWDSQIDWESLAKS